MSQRATIGGQLNPLHLAAADPDRIRTRARQDARDAIRRALAAARVAGEGEPNPRRRDGLSAVVPLLAAAEELLRMVEE